MNHIPQLFGWVLTAVVTAIAVFDIPSNSAPNCVFTLTTGPCGSGCHPVHQYSQATCNVISEGCCNGGCEVYWCYDNINEQLCSNPAVYKTWTGANPVYTSGTCAQSWQTACGQGTPTICLSGVAHRHPE